MRIELQIPEKLIPLITEDRRFKVIVGGRGSGKSQNVGAILATKADREGARILAAREHMNSISDSVHSLVSDQISKYQMPGFDIQANEIKHRSGGGFIYRGLARNAEGLKSVNDVKYCHVEEAQTVSADSLKILTPSIRAPGSEIWLTANPRSRADAFSQRFLVPFEKELARDGYYSDELHLIIVVNYIDNPWFPPELEMERQYDYEHLPRAKYNHIWLGDYDDTVDDAIITAEWFDACVDADKKLGFQAEGIEVIAHDPSDTGNDEKGVAYRHGSVIKDVQERNIGDVNEGGDWATDYALKRKPDIFMWDSCGMGLSLRRQFNQALKGKRITLQEYNGAGSCHQPDDVYEPVEDQRHEVKTNRETFKNLRAQSYWLLRDRIYKTYLAVKKNRMSPHDQLISFNGDMEFLSLLRSELCRIPLKYNPNGLIQLKTKEEMKRDGIESPNMADSVAMTINPLPIITRIPVSALPNSRRAARTRGGY